MSIIVELSSTIFNVIFSILSHWWVYLILWISQFFVVKIYVNKKNRAFGDISGVLLKFRILFIIALLIGFYLGVKLT